MSWHSPSPALIPLFEGLCPGPPVLRRTVFGSPAAFLNGNMFFGVFGDSLWVRLDDTSRTLLLQAPGASTLQISPGQPMQQYVVLPQAWLQDRDQLARWVARGRAYAETLVPQRPR